MQAIVEHVKQQLTAAGSSLSADKATELASLLTSEVAAEVTSEVAAEAASEAAAEAASEVTMMGGVQKTQA